jgi:hypothetical protein
MDGWMVVVVEVKGLLDLWLWLKILDENKILLECTLHQDSELSRMVLAYP